MTRAWKEDGACERGRVSDVETGSSVANLRVHGYTATKQKYKYKQRRFFSSLELQNGVSGNIPSDIAKLMSRPRRNVQRGVRHQIRLVFTCEHVEWGRGFR